MPPRIKAVDRLGGTFNLCLRPAAQPCTPSFLPVVQTASLSQKEKKRMQKQEPYRWAQMQQRKNANLQRREDLRQVREAAWGDPVHGKPTPFVESFDSAGQAPQSGIIKDANGNIISQPHDLPTSPHLLNHLLTRDELEGALQHAYQLTKPVRSHVLADSEANEIAQAEKEHEEKHARAVEAVRRIVSMDVADGKMRRHTNIRRCIETFGRHVTDGVLKPKPASINPNTTQMPERAGPDTGSSEVQIAILTSKIRTLSMALGRNKGYKDKHNRRNLRLLVHRRQKLLKYMEKKERGSERWTNLLQTLGLTPATWKGQITL